MGVGDTTSKERVDLLGIRNIRERVRDEESKDRESCGREERLSKITPRETPMTCVDEYTLVLILKMLGEAIDKLVVDAILVKV